jgi:hypothetical protein
MIGKEPGGMVDELLLISVCFAFFPVCEQFGRQCICTICEVVKRLGVLIYKKLQ